MEGIRNHSVIWPTARENGGDDDESAEIITERQTVAVISTQDPLNSPLITLTNNDCNQSAFVGC